MVAAAAAAAVVVAAAVPAAEWGTEKLNCGAHTARQAFMAELPADSGYTSRSVSELRPQIPAGINTAFNTVVRNRFDGTRTGAASSPTRNRSGLMPKC